MSASTKLHQLESKILELQHQYEHVLKERQQEIASLISVIDLAHLDDKTLIGGLLFLKDKITTQDVIVEAWHVAGEKFFRHHKPRSHSRSQPFQGKIPAGKSSQTTNKKHLTSKQTQAPQATDQSPQERFQQGEAIR